MKNKLYTPSMAPIESVTSSELTKRNKEFKK
jgi:hypothetical protein